MQASDLCDWILGADEKIRFSMVIDELGNVQCIKSIYYYEIPKELAIKLGDTLAVMAGSVFKELTPYHGKFEYVIVQHEKAATTGMKIKGGYLIFAAVIEATPELLQNVKETVKLHESSK